MVAIPQHADDDIAYGVYFAKDGTVSLYCFRCPIFILGIPIDKVSAAIGAHETDGSVLHGVLRAAKSRSQFRCEVHQVQQ